MIQGCQSRLYTMSFSQIFAAIIVIALVIGVAAIIRLSADLSNNHDDKEP